MQLEEDEAYQHPATRRNVFHAVDAHYSVNVNEPKNFYVTEFAL